MWSLWCWFVGHKRWLFTEYGALMIFKQAETIGEEAYQVEICSRCNKLYAFRVSYPTKI